MLTLYSAYNREEEIYSVEETPFTTRRAIFETACGVSKLDIAHSHVTRARILK